MGQGVMFGVASVQLGGCMTQHEKCREVNIDGWRGFCIYFEACRHRTATAAKHAIKETILEYVVGLLVRPTFSHLRRASHKITRRKELSM